jgi:pyrroline-5-carboxylate reductase
MGYTLCVLGVCIYRSFCYLSLITRSLLLGCGTMGVAITAGVLASLDSRSPLHGLSSGQPKWESHTPGTSTPTNIANNEPTLPSRFIACVKREEKARHLREKFRAVVGGEAVEVTVGENASAVQQSDVVLLWYVQQRPFHSPVRRIGQLLLTLLFSTFSCKPQVAHPILSGDGIKEALAGKLLISILTGVTISQLSSWVLPSTTVIRAMPNVACRVRFRGSSAIGVAV